MPPLPRPRTNFFLKILNNIFKNPSPILIGIHMVGVITVVITLILITQNPLSLLGLLLMPQVQLFNQPQDREDTDARGIGFLSNLEGIDLDNSEEEQQQKDLR